MREGVPVLLSDVATVSDSYSQQTNIVRINGQRASFVPILKNSTASTLAVVDAVNIPVVASGGVGNLDHLVEGAIDGGADAVLAASIFHYGEYTIAEAKERLSQAGIIVRPVS